MENDPIFTERFNCPNCEGAVPRENLLIRRLNGGRYEPARQEIHLHCEHCGCIAEIRRTRNGGLWQLDALDPVTADKQRVAILDRLEKQRARLQMEAA